ncbi:hypothetical protein LOK49_LG02G02588 [Camellia lanceoleosa]|uniref:Uncharacterized protein n=1 Tax=Camellia lanceoleosa TaxID=1840588 RepID=A0ACC0IH46_9ERIC|nr:hypothetical protein LOK49_LG02G02588 [Camellia lanceoleosa]
MEQKNGADEKLLVTNQPSVMSLEVERTVIDTNVKCVANMLRHLVHVMIESKQARNYCQYLTLSFLSIDVFLELIKYYSASKLAVECLTSSVAKESHSGMAIVALNPAPCIARFLSSNSAYIYLSVSFIQMLKALMPVAIYFVIEKLDVVNLDCVTGEVIFRDISFKYGEDMPLVLNGLDLYVKAGETITFVGPLRGGKITLMKLLLRLYDPLCGESFVIINLVLTYLF